MKGHIWINSDLQLADADEAHRLINNAVDDMRDLKVPLDAIWCLGDALVGSNLEALEAVADACIESYERLNAPIAYVLGNHETDFHRHTGMSRYPLYERVRNRAGWFTLPSLSDLYFYHDVLGFRVFFLGDHAAEDGSWFSSAGRVVGDESKYPHGREAFQALRTHIERSDKPVIIASHYAFEGGQRPNPKQRHLLPLPENVRVHFHGHAHIGDLVWNKEDPWEREHTIAHSRPMQYNISALENARTPGSHSALLSIGKNGTLHIRLRCHLEREWKETYRVEAR